MKIPQNVNIYYRESYFNKILIKWEEEAAKFGIAEGCYVQVKYALREINDYVDRIYLESLGKEFESFKELSKVLNNKAFL